MEGKKISQDESRRMVSEFFVKSLNVILGARIPSKYLQPQSSSSSASANRSFNLVLVNSPMRNKCHLSVVEPIVVDVLLLHHGSSACAGIQDQVFQWNPSQQTQQSQSLLERWVVHCVPWTCLKSGEKTTQSPDRGTKNRTSSTAKKPPLSRRSAAPPPPPAEEKKGPWKKAVKMLSIMLRSLYNLTRLLPAYRIFQQLNSTSSPGSPGCCHFDLSYKVRSTLSVVAGNGSCDKSLCKFNLTPVETELGRMCISVKYSDAASVERAMQRTGSIFSEIIQDYVAGGGGDGSGGGSSGSSQNPHFAVSDRRICAVTRTMSSNIPAATVAAAAAAVRRSYSSRLDPIELDKQQQQLELVCPFACDDEQKVSRDAAAGALITALISAAPIEQSPPRDHSSRSTGTLNDALRELKSYTAIARKKAVNI